jgi:hypothetical protein
VGVVCDIVRQQDLCRFVWGLFVRRKREKDRCGLWDVRGRVMYLDGFGGKTQI